MADQIWFLRHGEAEAHGGVPDEQRRLTARGEQQARTAGAALARLQLVFHQVLSSPRVRALETARLACEALGREVEVHDGLSAGFDRDDALALLAACPEGQRVLVVGHEPDFSQTVHDLTGGRVDFKKGGVAGVRMAGVGVGELIVLLRPRELDAIAG